MQQYLPWLIAGAVGALVAALVALWRQHAARQRAPSPLPLPTQWDLAPRPVFTADERRVYRQLREALPHHVVLAKLPLVRLCQPTDPNTVRYWYNLLGSINVTYAICSANGRVLAAVDLNYDNGNPPSRATRIKHAVLAACRIRYLRCPADHLPSIPELQLLVPHGTGALRSAQPLSAAAPMPMAPPAAAGRAAAPRPRGERGPLWQESSAFMDSFFNHDRSFENSAMGDLRQMPDAGDAVIVAEAGPPTAAEPPPRSAAQR